MRQKILFNELMYHLNPTRMEYKHTFSLMFFIRKERKNKNGEVPIYLRISVDGKKSEISLKQYVDLKKWNAQANKVKGTNKEAREINTYLDHVKVKIHQAYRNLQEQDRPVTSQVLKNMFLGTTEKRKTLVETFQYHNQLMKEEVGKTYAPATHKRFTTTLAHIEKFLEHQYNRADITLSEIEYSFITNLEHYFKTQKNCNHNTTAKYIKNLRKIINLAVNNGWMVKDPFRQYKIKFKETKRQYLTEEELDKLKNKEMSVPRLEHVKDIFLFSCYTGFAYVDIENLTKHNLQKGIDGNIWIYKDRMKTKTESRVPLLPYAKQIIEKYEDHPLVVDSDKLLPILTNQKMNAYLKEIASICGIDKNLTFHMARHTFATTILLSNGVSIESVSAMLGHKKISTTQIYSKVTEQKVSKEVQSLMNLDLKKTSKKKTS